MNFLDSYPDQAVVATSDSRSWLQLLIYLKATGLSNKNCAELLGKTPTSVHQAVKRPEIREAIAQTVRNNGQAAVERLLQGSVVESVLVLQEIRDDNHAPTAARVKAADSLIDRGIGRAVSRTEVIHYNGKSRDEEADIKQLSAEIVELRNRAKALGLTLPE